MPWYFYTYFALLLAGIVTGALRWRTLTPALRILWFLLICTFAIEAAGRWLTFQNLGNYLVYSVFRPVSFGLVTWAFYTELRLRIMPFTAIAFTALHVLNGIFLQPFGEVYDSNSMLLSMLGVAFWCLLYLRRLLQFPEEKYLTSYALFWISCGLLLFVASTLAGFASLNASFLPQFRSAYPVLTTLRAATNHILYSIYLFSFLGRKVSLSPKHVVP
jgi:hypothetical protein